MNYASNFPTKKRAGVVSYIVKFGIRKADFLSNASPNFRQKHPVKAVFMIMCLIFNYHV